jgi:hypothetical protein
MVKLQTFSGRASVFVNPIWPITNANYTQAKWSSLDFENDELILTPTDRNESVGTYYICVYGITQSTYKLIA